MRFNVKYLCKIGINTGNNNFWNFVYCVMGNAVRNVVRNIYLPPPPHAKTSHSENTDTNTMNHITHRLLTCREKVQCKESYGN